MTEPLKAVFLSYASQDAETARRICQALGAAGIEVWFDQSELRGGDAWDHRIRRQIRDCALFIPLISGNTNSRPEGYFRLEWKLAVDRSHLMADDEPFLLPIVVDGTLDANARVPDKFRQVQWTRLPEGATLPVFIDHVSRLLVHDPAVSPAVIGMPRTVPAHRQVSTGARVSSASKYAWLLITGAAILAGGYLALDKFVLSRRAVDTAQAIATGHSVPPVTAAIPEKSIAVLPFVDMSENRDQEYFADGMAEEILDQLVRIPQLTVISRTSSFQYKGKNTDVRGIGAALGAHYVVEGSVRKSGSQLRITAQLIDARDGSHRWSDRYDRDIGDALKVQDEIAASLVRALEVSVDTDEMPARTALKVPAAYDAYLRGRHAYDRYDQAGFEEAVDLFKQALRLDPSFARAAGELAVAQTGLGEWGYLPVSSAFDEARASAELAVRLDPTLAVPHVALAWVHIIHDWDWPAAEREFKQSTALEPRNAQAAWIGGQLAMALGRWDEATRLANQSLELDPLFAIGFYSLGEIRFRAGHPEETETAIRRLLQISPTYTWAHLQLARVLLARGDRTGAMTIITQEPEEEPRLAGLAMVQYALGKMPASDEALTHLIQIAAGDWAYGIASVYAFRAESDHAFEWLERAYEQKDVDLYGIKGEPVFQNIEHDPRYKTLLRKLNLPE